MKQTPKELDLISDVVLNYKPKEKAKASKRREEYDRGRTEGRREAMADKRWEDAVRKELHRAYQEGYRDAEAKRQSQLDDPVSMEHTSTAFEDSIASLRGTRRIEALRSQYEALRSQYEALRRPFTLTDSVPRFDIWDYRTVPPFECKHPCEKPLKMLQDIVVSCSRADAVVLDPFMGSGTTLVAAKQLGRRAIGIEIEEKYCEIAVARLSQEVLEFA